ncbi:MAG TPA: 4Fe-4S binding protein, partial [Spirochaetia bacterium]
LVTTYELYTENSLRACALLAREAGMTVMGSAAIRAPGSDLTCVIPDWLCGWLYRFEPGLAKKLRAIARDVGDLARNGGDLARRAGPERLPRWKWYTPAARALQWIFDGFFAWRARIRILSERCTSCGACIGRCPRGAWVRDGDTIRHLPDRCELCTACIHHCSRSAIVLARALRDNRRLDDRHYAGLRDRARKALLLAG